MIDDKSYQSVLDSERRFRDKVVNLRPQLFAEREEHVETKRHMVWLADLVRYQRMELFEAGLISEDEYGEIMQNPGSVERLETYDEMKCRLADATNAVVRECAKEACRLCSAEVPIGATTGFPMHLTVEGYMLHCTAGHIRIRYPDAFAPTTEREIASARIKEAVDRIYTATSDKEWFDAADAIFQPSIATPEHVAEKVERLTWEACTQHEWRENPNSDLGGNRTEVVCVKCDMPGERSDQLGECLWLIPEFPAMPICVRYFAPTRSLGVWADGHDCPCWEARNAKAK